MARSLARRGSGATAAAADAAFEGRAVYVFLGGVTLLAAILGLFWLKDRLRSPFLARIAYSGLVARLAVVGAALSAVGLLLILVELGKRVFA